MLARRRSCPKRGPGLPPPISCRRAAGIQLSRVGPLGHRSGSGGSRAEEMASITREFTVDVVVEDVWDAIRDVGRLHSRLVPGFVVGTQLDGENRTVTFANGSTVVERIVDVDNDHRRLAWTILRGRFEHYNGSIQAIPAPGGATRVVWIVDVLPHSFRDWISGRMDEGVRAMRQSFGSNLHRGAQWVA